MKHLSLIALLSCLLTVRGADPVPAPPTQEGPKPAAGSAPPERVIEFNRDVRPILSDACFACHGFDPKSRKAKLRLDIPEGAFAEREGTFPIKPGDPKKSEVWKRIVTDDAESVMPPPHSNKKLTDAQKETLRLWISQGAKYQKHWAFETIQRQKAPETRNPIDAFLLTRLQKEGLKPTPAADLETLIRRVSFALTGLPPTIKELDEFLADKSPNAYEKMVDRYLASPRFGEEMARHWLDVARYADTHGLHLDNERLMWKYRDWVVKAFNENLPFDKFTVYQLAGDLLPNPTSDQLTATGFSRCNVTTGEGGSIDEEWLYRNAVDRATTATQAFLGLTAGCAVCHDHKFDPISTKEYYSLYAFFYSGADPALDSNVSTTGPFVKVPSPTQKTSLEVAAKAEQDARVALEKAAESAKYTDPATATSAKPVEVRDVLFDDALPPGATNRNTTRNSADWVTDPSFRAHSGRRVLRQANTFFHEDVIQFRNAIRVPGTANLEAWVYIDPKQPPRAITLQLSGGKKLWWGTDSTPGNLGTRIGALPKAGEWVKLSITLADLGLKESQSVSSLTLQEHSGVVYWDAVAFKGQSVPSTDALASFQVWWKSLNGKAPPDLPTDLNAIAVNGPAKSHTPAGAAKLQAFYLAHVARPATEELNQRRTEWEKARAEHFIAADAIPGTMVFRDLPVPRDSFVMLRGQYDKKGDKVVPGVPGVLPPLKLADPKKRATRLDLANWIVAPENPLTARVAANRLWQQFFGTGLVKTSSDFGSQGEPPSHPELLDWLASEYASHWDTKKLVKLLVMTDAFKRDASQPADVRAKDPANRFLSRGPRFRLDAEQLRDNALFVSGLMSNQMGGRGVNPYQPPNIWEPVGYADSNTRYYLQDHGEALYRRSLYVFIKRTAPAPFLTNFDATNREQLCAGRDRTNTPLQALQLMNDVQHFEAARALAELALADGGKTTEDRVTFLYRAVLSRKPDADELKLVTAALTTQRELFTAKPELAKKVVFAGESKPKGVASDVDIAVWTMIANLVLNLDEAVTRN
ncbi:PSD1 domain-containing protein [Gemmata sp. G18]|uniref:PSD1 domain-containing protein n=1 Tax=Gemmata palustris TaxID=2822762 RepID=A0ABS5BKH4_9BACT|nr:PSD1 and planctomycete cytochrome C domain-containing protein [Gemmata palustris]MBP3953982.1 PSD1 domain-containing protein [Gemmata palustris]